MAIAEELRLEVKAEVNKAVADMNRFNTTTQKSKMGIRSLTSQLGGWVTGMITVTAAVVALRKAMQIAFDAAQYAAQVSQIEKAFGNIAKSAGYSSATVLAEVRKMSLGTISDLKLMQAASRAALFDIPLDKLDELMHIAMASATATGESVEYMFQSIVTGIGRASPMILDNLGLAIRTGEAYKAFADKLGKTSEQLSIAERKQALLNEVLRAGGDIMDKVGDAAIEMTDAQRWEQLTSSIQNLKGELGRALLPAFRELTIEANELVNRFTEIIKFRNIVKGLVPADPQERIEALNAEIARLEAQMKNPFVLLGLGIASPVFIARRKKQIADLQVQLALAQRSIALNQQYGKELEERQAAEIKAAEVEAQRAQQAAELASYLLEVEKRYAKTPEGIQKALEAEIAYWEDHLSRANKTAPQIRAIIDDLKEELDSLHKEEKDSGWPERVAEINREVQAAMDLYELQTQALLTAETERKKIQEELKKIYEEEADKRVLAINAEVQNAMDLYELQTKALQTAEEERTKIEKEQARERKRIEEDLARAKMATINSMISSLDTIWGNYFTSRMEGMDRESTEYKKLARDRARGEKAMALFQAIVNTASAITKALASAPPPFNIALAALSGAAGAAQIAAIASTPLPALAEGGIVTKPTLAMIGEKGPEAVVPLGRGDAAPTIVVNVSGSVLTEEGIARRIGSIWRRQNRGY